MGQFEDTILDFSTTITMNPDNPSYYKNRGLVYYKIQNYDLALLDYDKALSISPQYGEALYRKSQVFWALGDTKNALFSAKKAIEYGYTISEEYLKSLKSG